MAGRKLKKAGGGSRPNGDINMTPLVDVVLVLLIIFMVVTPLLEKDIEVRLPDDEQADTTEPPPDLLSQLMVTVSKTGEVALNTERMSFDVYATRIKRALAAKPKGDRLVFFLPDDKANYGKVVKALDIAKRAGAETLGMVTGDLDPPAGKSAKK